MLFGYLAGVITTPSTVALDAARVRMPVAVVAKGLEIKNYEPLTLVNNLDDWHDFIKLATDDIRCKELNQKSRQFVDRVLVSGDAATRIIESIIAYSKIRERKNAA